MPWCFGIFGKSDTYVIGDYRERTRKSTIVKVEPVDDDRINSNEQLQAIQENDNQAEYTIETDRETVDAVSSDTVIEVDNPVRNSIDSIITNEDIERAPDNVESEGKLPKNEDNEVNGDVVEDEEKNRRRSGVVPERIIFDEEKSDLPVFEKDNCDQELIKSALTNNEFLNKLLTGKRLQNVIDAMYKQDVAAKKAIIKEGDTGAQMYVSVEGEFQVLVKNKEVLRFSDVRVFGELAILYNAKRLATIKCIRNGFVWALDRKIFQKIMIQSNIADENEMLEFLQNVSSLQTVNKEILQQVTKLFKTEFFKTGTEIVRQGDQGDKFYIITAGTVTISKKREGIVNNFGRGQHFGERALQGEDCRQATVIADSPGVECWTLTRQQFIDHFGDIEIPSIKIEPKISIATEDVIITEYDDIDLRDLKIVKTLGIGGFGRVELVQHNTKKDLVFALKYLKKIDIVQQNQIEHVYNEKNIQLRSNSPFIVKLYNTYKDKKYIYFLMESCLGGDLFSLMQRQEKRRFKEKDARFICGCVLEAFAYLHKQGIVYRDLKPENLLIDSRGYIKLTDFGFAKKIKSGSKTYTFAGTPEYVAPEIVLNRGHDKAVDYWAYGIFIFEMLSGKTPFRTNDSSHMKTYNKILKGVNDSLFPPHISIKARNIIEKLLKAVPAERLGMQRDGIKDIRSHKWFMGFDWQRLTEGRLVSEFKPKLKGPVDTQHFEDFTRYNDNPQDEESGWDDKF